MIEMGKQYKTRDGRAVRIYAMDGGWNRSPIHGAVMGDEGWEPSWWTADGKSSEYDGWTLVEVKPGITRWHVVSEYLGYATQEEAQAAAREFFGGCPVAVASVTFRTGDGL